MAKIRESTRKIGANTATTKAKTTTPAKTMIGKVHKVRVNIKNMVKSIKTNDETSKVNSIESIDQTGLPTQTRLCFVKLQRSPAHDTTRLYNNNNNNNNNSLQAQCKVNDKNTKTYNELQSLVESATEINNAVEKANTNSRRRKVNAGFSEKSNLNCEIINNSAAKTNNKTSDTAANTENNMSSNTNDTQKRCFIKLPRSKKQKEHHDIEDFKSKRNRKGGSEIKDNVVAPSTPSTTKRCVVKLQRTPVTLKASDIVVEPSTPSTTKSCVIKLNKTPVAIESKHIVTERSAQNSIRECRVTLPRTQISQRNKGDGEHVSSNNLPVIPVIDKNKRDNFRKLSLTKSTRKSTENKEKGNNKNSSLEEKIIDGHNNNNSVSLTSDNQTKAQKCIKLLGKLSLRRPHLQNNRNVSTTNLELTQFEPHQNSTIFFEPSRNSTLLEFGFTKDQNKIIPKAKTQEVSPAKNKSLSQNLVNKSVEIENILNSLDDDDELLLMSQDNEKAENNAETQNEIQAEKTQNNISTSRNQTNKFFHRQKEDIQANNLKLNTRSKTTTEAVKIVEKQNNNSTFKNPSSTTNAENRDSSEPTTKSPPKHQNEVKKSRFLTKRSTMVSRENIYDFLSQSQTSDSEGTSKHADPTADIIKKLIKQGKVRVATNCKGTGKPKLKPKPIKRPKKKVNQKTGNKLKTNKKKTTATKEHEIVDDKVALEHHDNFDNYESILDDDYDMDNHRPEAAKVLNNNHKARNLSNDQEGTFSRLARTVLINEAGRSDLQRKNASLLLEKIKKFVSTPKNKQMPAPQVGLEVELSPIPMAPVRPATIASPWRVDEDAFLPKTFNFARSSGNLPSFSSDYIPSTPTKEKPKNHVYMPTDTAITSNRSPVIGNQNPAASLTPHASAENIQPQTLHQNEPSVVSSFSSNDSNAENMTPPKSKLGSHNNNENIFDMKQLPNPRRALKYRSPLKNINILEVVHLPPYKAKDSNKTPNTKESGDVAIEMFGFEENLGEDSMRVDQSKAGNNVSHQADTNKATNNHSKEDLFGFEDMLSQTEFSTQECDNTANDESTTNAQNQTIHDKLYDLRKLKPAENELELSLHREKTRRPLKTLPMFEDDATNADGMRQKSIKEMLCSTLINPQPSTSKEALRQLKKRNWKDSKRPNFGEELDLSELFKDPEPETTFNEDDAHRTYIRPYKRKRRLKQNKYVMFLDSEESGDEQSSAEQRKLQRSHETDTSSEQAPKKKRQRKEPKEKPALTEFVEEFNEMCKEVDSYELIVEKSA